MSTSNTGSVGILHPKVTVITGYYQRPDVVARTLQSILDQTLTDFELIVFDDASPDETATRIEDFVRTAADPRVHPVYHRSNIGFVNGLIDAINMARGKYIAIQGSGDVSLPDRLAKQVAVLEENPTIGLVATSFELIDESGNLRRPVKLPQRTLSHDELHKKNVICQGSAMLRLSAYINAGGYRSQFIYSQDRDLWFRMLKCSGGVILPDVLYHRYIDRTGVSYAPHKFAVQQQFAELACQLAPLPSSKQAEILERYDGDPYKLLSTYRKLRFNSKLLRMTIRNALADDDSEKAVALTDHIRYSPYRSIVRGFENIMKMFPRFQKSAARAILRSKPPGT